MAAYTCSRCKQSKDESEFYRDRSRPNGRQAYCRACHAIVNQTRQAERYHNDPAFRERRLAKDRERRRHPDPDRRRHPRRITGDPNQLFVCSICKRGKKIGAYTTRVVNRDGSTSVGSHCDHCRRRRRRENYHDAKIAKRIAAEAERIELFRTGAS